MFRGVVLPLLASVVIVAAAVALAAVLAPAAIVGDDHPPLANYTIDSVAQLPAGWGDEQDGGKYRL